MHNIQKEKIQHIKDVIDKHKNEIEKYGILGTGIGFIKKDEVTNELGIYSTLRRKMI